LHRPAFHDLFTSQKKEETFLRTYSVNPVTFCFLLIILSWLVMLEIQIATVNPSFENAG